MASACGYRHLLEFIADDLSTRKNDTAGLLGKRFSGVGKQQILWFLVGLLSSITRCFHGCVGLHDAWSERV